MISDHAPTAPHPPAFFPLINVRVRKSWFGCKISQKERWWHQTDTHQARGSTGSTHCPRVCALPRLLETWAAFGSLSICLVFSLSRYLSPIYLSYPLAVISSYLSSAICHLSSMYLSPITHLCLSISLSFIYLLIYICHLSTIIYHPSIYHLFIYRSIIFHLFIYRSIYPSIIYHVYL